VGRRGGRGTLIRKPLPRSFYERPVLEVARDLLGRDVWHGGVVVRLTEVEAYRAADDVASHAHRGRTDRNAVMFGPPGFVYVYFTYGMHWCMNLVCQPEGEAAAVLLRAGRVVGGAEIAASRRPGAAPRDLARGPVRVVPGVPVADDVVRTGPRVGVVGAADLPWRFYVADDPTVSVYRPAAARKPRKAPTA
jgi:DNA-3-methyladenine glycosylase